MKAIPNYEAPTDFREDNSYNVTLIAEASDHRVTFPVVVTVTNRDEAGQIRLSAQPLVNKELTATVSDLDGVLSEDWTWECSTSRDGPWTALTGSGNNYTPAEADINQYLRVTATYTDGHEAGKTLNYTTERRVAPDSAVDTNHHPEFSGGAPAALRP